jgi:amidohydrolase family protein
MGASGNDTRCPSVGKMTLSPRMDRRDVLQLLAAAPAAALGACCTTKYPGKLRSQASGADAHTLEIFRGVLAPFADRESAGDARMAVVDPHAHFFNAADVPVKGFIQECLGHAAPAILQPLIAAAALIANHLADRAPDAKKELAELRTVADLAPRNADAPQRSRARAEAKRQTDNDRNDAASRLVSVLRERDGRRFEQEYLRLKRAGAQSAPDPAAAADAALPAITEDHVKRVLQRAEQPIASSADQPRQPTPTTEAQVGADGADGLLAFLGYMLSMRRSNLEAYIRTFTTGAHAIGISTVFGALVDFDYWLDCPPRSIHADQIEVHRRLADLYGDYFRPVVAYNPWVDIAQNDAGLARVKYACKTLGFVAVKIYPPTGFLPAMNVNRPKSRKPHPSFRDLDQKLKAFFDFCTAAKIPVISHTAHSNGRDREHDTFGGPSGWMALLKQYAAGATPTIDFGHFGGGSGPEWTDGFAALIKANPHARLFADLGYWDELMCPGTAEKPCTAGQARLTRALAVPVGDEGETVADRTMFATDWLMLSQVKRWADYPAALRATLETIAPVHVAAIMGGNAGRCFNLTRS